MRIFSTLLPLFAIGLMGCFPNSQFDSCDDGQQLAIVSGQEGCFPSCAAGCSGDTTCVDGICVSSELLKDPGPITVNNENNGMVSITGLTEEEAEELCDAVASQYFGCAEDHCTLSDAEQAAVDGVERAFLEGGPDRDSCKEAALSSPGFVETLTPISMQSCEDTRYARCAELQLSASCDCTPPDTIGDTCSSDQDCETGDFPSICSRQPENPSGYCASFCPDSDPQQAEDYIVTYDETCAGGHCSVFIDVGENGEEIRGGFCLRDCEEQSDCEGESVCVIVANDNVNTKYIRACSPFGFCNDTTCPPAFGRCSEDLACEPRCATAAGRTACTNSGGTCEGDAEMFCVLP